ncbi:MAG: DUF262 domain-containing protein [Thermoguttaceae bacterium]|nr:DUF262 domain-containing protein [Thermoguttaceae bacterium]
MKIQLKSIKIRDIVKGYEDNGEDGVFGYGGRLNIRPPYQREFIYKEHQRNAVIDTVYKGFPLNTMYWNVCPDGNYEIIDGQQRTVSICQYVECDFSIPINGNPLGFNNLTDTQQKRILDYELTVYFCQGTEEERLEWFKTINIAGEELTPQELRNSVYHGPFVTDARRRFSKTNCTAYKIGHPYLTGSTIRQDYLETALKWLTKGGDHEIKEYMAKHQNDPNANELWLYFSSVIEWINATFRPTKDQEKLMKGLDWGALYDAYHKKQFNLKKVNALYDELLLDDDVTSKKGIYPYIITKDSKYLSLRQFSPAQKQTAYKKQKGNCAKCGKHFELDAMEADHITPWSKGGKTVQENCQCLCKECNRRKSNK